MPLYLYNGALLVENGALGADQDCCCCPSACGENCQQTVTVNFSADGFDGQIVFVVADGGNSVDFDEMPANFNLASAFIFCTVVDGCAQWTVSFTVCYFDGVDTITEEWEGSIGADSDGCPRTGNVTMNIVFGNGQTTVTASIA